MHEDLEWILEDSEDPAASDQVREGASVNFLCLLPIKCSNSCQPPFSPHAAQASSKTVDLLWISFEKDSCSQKLGFVVKPERHAPHAH